MIQYFHPYLKWSWIFDFPIFFHFCAFEHFRPATKKFRNEIHFFSVGGKKTERHLSCHFWDFDVQKKNCRRRKDGGREREWEQVCVCVRERERERERESEREWDSQPIDHFNVQTFSFTSILEFLQFFFSFDSTDFEVKKFFVTILKSWTTSQKK